MKTLMMDVAKHISVAVAGPLTTSRCKVGSIAVAFGSAAGNGVGPMGMPVLFHQQDPAACETSHGIGILFLPTLMTRPVCDLILKADNLSWVQQ